MSYQTINLIHLAVDDSARLPIYLVFLIFTTIILPVWWWTTSVPRANLTFPTWSTLPHKLTRLGRFQIFLVNLENKSWNGLFGNELEILPSQELGSNKLEFHERLRLTVSKRTFDHIGDNVSDIAESWLRQDPVEDKVGVYRLYLFDAATTGPPSLWFHASQRVILYGNVSQMKEFETPQRFLDQTLSSIIRHFNEGDNNDRLMADSSKYQVTFTLVVGQDLAREKLRTLRWDIEMAAGKYFLPSLIKLQLIADFIVHYQVRAVAELPFKVVGNDANEFIISSDQLPVFFDENKWNLDASISDAIPINFVLFVPPGSQQPMKIENTDSKIFRLAQWGAIYILNHGEGDDLVSSNDLKPIMSAFAGQLWQLFGNRQKSIGPEDNGLQVSSKDRTIQFELETLHTRVCRQRYLSAISTLQALQRLLDRSAEIVVLPAVGKLVSNSLAALHMTKTFLQGGNWEEALISASQAVQYADAAFFHPTMMAHQYFPQEHKLGVYTPLFFPFVLPIALASIVRFSTWAKYSINKLK